MLLRTSTKQYEIYYDESNNIRKLYLEGEQYNIDKDPNQESSPIFVLAGIAFDSNSIELDFEQLKKDLQIPKNKEKGKQDRELKFSHMAKIRAKYTPIEAFKYALGSKHFKTLFNRLLSNKIFIHYEMINTVYWSFLDIVDDLVIFTKDNRDIVLHTKYKDALYRLIKLDKENFLNLMSEFDFPYIEKGNSLDFLKAFHSLIQKNLMFIFKTEGHSIYAQMLMMLGTLTIRCINMLSDDFEFELVFDTEKGVLINDLSNFYINRVQMFPNSKHVMDNEELIEKKFKEYKNCDNNFTSLDITFVDSKLSENYLTQISDVVAGFIRLYFNFLEYASIDEVSVFTSNLNNLQKDNLELFKKLLARSIEESEILLHRVIVPIDEHKAFTLLKI